MLTLVDTNVIARRVLPADTRHALARAALDRLLWRGETVCVRHPLFERSICTP